MFLHDDCIYIKYWHLINLFSPTNSMKISKFLKKIDMFPNKLTPSFKGKDSITTTLGGLLSILITILFILSVFAFGNDF